MATAPQKQTQDTSSTTKLECITCIPWFNWYHTLKIQLDAMSFYILINLPYSPKYFFLGLENNGPSNSSFLCLESYNFN